MQTPTESPTELLLNGDFGAPGRGPTTNPNYGSSEDSAAPHWLTWNNTRGVTTKTDLQPSDLQGHTQKLHVVTGDRCGIDQPFPEVDGPAHTKVRVYVVDGIVGIGIDKVGATSMTTFSKTTGRWELLIAKSNAPKVSQVIIYGSGGAAEYYVGDVSAKRGEG